MKKILLSALFLTLAACATLKSDRPELTLTNVENQCTRAEQWRMNVMGVGAFVVVYNDCFTHKKLLVIPVEKIEGHPENIQELTAELIKNHFLHYISEREKKDYNWSVKVLKTELGDRLTTNFYELIGKKVEAK